MALRRKQQKLAGFGARWQTADPTVAIAREGEVGRALAVTAKLYKAQQHVQSTDTTCECVAVYHADRGFAVLTRRRGQVVESFGRRAEGQWLLAPEDVLYLAERGTLAVHEAVPTSDGVAAAAREALQDNRDDCAGRRLSLPEIFALTIGDIGLQSYATYAHLRRAGHTVRPLAAGQSVSCNVAVGRRCSCSVNWLSGPPVTASGSTDWLLVGCPLPVDWQACAACWSSSTGVADATGVAVHAAEARQEFHASLASHGILSSKLSEGTHVLAVADALGDLEFMELAAPTHPCDRRGGESPTQERQVSGAQASSDSEGTSPPARGAAAKRGAATCQLDTDSAQRYAALRRRVADLVGQGPPGTLAPKPSREEANQAEAWL